MQAFEAGAPKSHSNLTHEPKYHKDIFGAQGPKLTLLYCTVLGADSAGLGLLGGKKTRASSIAGVRCPNHLPTTCSLPASLQMLRTVLRYC
jgi:hypothetical protein